ncbi:MAG: hypothetical protein ACPGVG_17065 [Mycobacterium sp.]
MAKTLTLGPQIPAYIRALAQYEAVELDPGLNAVAADGSTNGPTWNPDDPGTAPWFGVIDSGPNAGNPGGGSFATNDRYVAGTFSGMALDKDRATIVWWRRGGHSDGNDASCYKTYLNASPPYSELWAVTTEDTDQATPYEGKGADGHPWAYHTNRTQDWSPVLDKIVGCFQQAPYPDIGSSGSLIVHTFDHVDEGVTNLRARQLANFTEYDEFPASAVSSSYQYASHFTNTIDSKEYWLTNGTSASSLCRWDETNGDVTVIAPLTTLGAVGNECQTVFIPEGTNGYAATNKTVSGAQELQIIDLNSNAITTPTVTDTGSDFTAVQNFDWDNTDRRLVGWNGGNELVFCAAGTNPASDTWTVSTQAITGDTLPTDLDSGTPGNQTNLSGRCKICTIEGVRLLYMVMTNTQMFAVRLSAP